MMMTGLLVAVVQPGSSISVEKVIILTVKFALKSAVNFHTQVPPISGMRQRSP